MRTEKIHFRDATTIEIVLQTLTQQKHKRILSGATNIDIKFIETKQLDDWGARFVMTTPDDESIWFDVYLSHKKVCEAVLQELKHVHLDLFDKFPETWTLHITIGRRDNYGDIWVWAEPT